MSDVENSRTANARGIFKTKQELETAAKLLQLGWAQLFMQDRKDPDNPTEDELKHEYNCASNFGQRMVCWAEAYHQFRSSGEISEDILADYDEKLVKNERASWRDLYENSMLFEEGNDDDKRFK